MIRKLMEGSKLWKKETVQLTSRQKSKNYMPLQGLEAQFPGRRFTPDGHLVGSIGEVLVADHYGLTLLPNSTETHDAVSSDGRKIQIKTTQINRIAILSEPNYLIVIKISDRGKWEEIYNGPGHLVWISAGKMQKNGPRPITLAKLQSLMCKISEKEQIKSQK